MGYVMSRVAGFIRTFALLLLVAALSQAALAQTNAEQETHAELILDASGSMFNRLADGRYRIVAAKEVLAELIAALPASPDLNVGYRAYGSELQATAAGSCEDSRLYVPIEGVQRQLLLDTVKGTQARAATPIAYSLQLALNDLQGRSGQKLVVLITDGEEGCGGDVRAAAEALQAAGIDLRIIGFDLNDAARAAFQGIGVFENATSAAELLAALNRAVVETAAPAAPPAPAAYPVTVTLLREGQPATDGPVVAFTPALGGADDAESLALRDGSFHADLPAGAYVAKVSDAHSAEPLTITGLTVTPEGPNAFEFELAPSLDVVITPATSTPNAGATLTVAWEGAPDVRNGYIALAPAGEDLVILYMDAPGSGGEGTMRLPSRPGDYDLRYQLDQPSGATDLLGVTAISLQPVAVSLDAPAEAVAGGYLPVTWEGPDNQHDFITIVPAGTEQGMWTACQETASGNPLELRVPTEAGEYEVRYADGYSTETLGSIPLLVTEATAAFTAPTEAVAGSIIILNVTAATAHPYDYIALVTPDTHEHDWGRNYTYIDGVGQFELTTDEIPGEYLLRYQTEDAGPALFSQPITILPATATVSAPASVGAGQPFDVTWEGPGNVGDFVTIVPAGTAEGEWGYYDEVGNSSPTVLYAPDEPGEYEVRYVTSQLGLTLARAPITVR